MLMLKSIQLIASDFDGVMTDNRVLVDDTGKESVFVNRADGQAVHILRAMGIDLVVISSEKNGVVKKRAEKMGIECIYGVADKAECLKQYCHENKITLQNVAYVGNDVNDYEAMQIAGVKIAPQDAYHEVKVIADYTTIAKGGEGVIREIAGLIKMQKNQ